MEIQILDWIQKIFHCQFLDIWMPAMSWLGNFGIIWITITIFLFFRKESRYVAVNLLLVLSLCTLIGNFILKPTLKRSRPYEKKEELSLLIEKPKDYSFPSGHTMTSFAAACILFSYHKKWGILAYFIAGLIAFSRLYLYVHYPTDVLVGILLGTGISLWILYIRKKDLPTA